MRTRAVSTLSALLLLGLAAPAQNPSSRDFEQCFFARREAWLDRLFRSAGPELREKALEHVYRAWNQSGPSLAGGRCRSLAAAAAVLNGLEADDEDFLARFNFYLLALPEVVDPKKTVQDVRTVDRIGRKVFPMIRRGIDEEQVLAEMNRIFVTARGVFAGFGKPEGLKLRMRTRDTAGRTLAVRERGDSSDEAGWTRFDLFESFSMAGKKPGSYRAGASVGIHGEWARQADAPLVTSFALRPGFHRDVWRFLELKNKLFAAGGSKRPALHHLARLNVIATELLRVVVLGKDFVFRSWPVEALGEGLELLESLERGTEPELPRSGDRVYGVMLEGGGALPVRVIWSEAPAEGWDEAWIVLAPDGWDEHFAIQGLGLERREILGRKGRVIAFLHHPGGVGYIQGVQALLEREFGIRPKKTSVLGLRDGGIRMQYGLHLFKGPLDRVVFVGGAIPVAETLTSGRSIRIIPAYGRPGRDRLEVLRLRMRHVFGSDEHERVKVDARGPRSIAEALLRIWG
ncbi:MAG: hypothetical protein ACE5F1_10015 [Planctomycetota bacterium]